MPAAHERAEAAIAAGCLRCPACAGEGVLPGPAICAACGAAGFIVPPAGLPKARAE